MKNRITIIFLSLILFLPLISKAETDINVVPEPTTAVEENIGTEEEFISEHNLDDESIEREDSAEETEVLTTTQNQYKNPISKKKLAKKFLLAMFGVAISSFMIFAILTLYNRVRENISGQTKTPEGEVSLDIPDGIESAVQTFLEKTKW